MLITTCLCEHSVGVYLHVHTDCKGKPRHKLRTVAKVLSQRAADTNTDVPMGAAGQGQARCAGRVKPDER